MWKPSDLRLDFIKMKSGALDNLQSSEIKDIIKYHNKEVAKVREQMSVELFQECDELLGFLSAFYEDHKAWTKGKKSKGNKEETSNELTPTELFKQHFGENPSQVFRKQFDQFDKTAYARWLRDQTRHLRHQK